MLVYFTVALSSCLYILFVFIFLYFIYVCACVFLCFSFHHFILCVCVCVYVHFLFPIILSCVCVCVYVHFYVFLSLILSCVLPHYLTPAKRVLLLLLSHQFVLCIPCGRYFSIPPLQQLLHQEKCVCIRINKISNYFNPPFLGSTGST